MNEHRNLQLSDNERLEFLGDAVLEPTASQVFIPFISSFARRKIDKNTSCDRSRRQLVEICQRIITLINMFCWAREKRIQEDVRDQHCFATYSKPFLGALYLDQGFEHDPCIHRKSDFSEVKAGAFSHEMDDKANVQEVLQKSGDVSIEYRSINEEGPAHERVFWIEVYVDDQLIGTGQGKSKKLAEQAAAENALAAL